MASNSNSNYKAKAGSLKSPQTKKTTSTQKQASTQKQTSTTSTYKQPSSSTPTYKQSSTSTTTTTSCAPSTKTYYQTASTPTESIANSNNQRGKTPFQDRYDRNAEQGLELTDLIRREKEKAGITSNQTQKKATNPAAVNFSSLNNSLISKNNDKSSDKKIVPINRGNGTSVNVSYKISNYNASNTKNNNVESLNVINNMKIDISSLDLSKISRSSSDARDNNYVSVNEKIWNSADLNITEREDGTFLIQNGDVPIGFTNKDGFKRVNSQSSNGSNLKNDGTKDETKTIGSNIGSRGLLSVTDLNLNRLSNTAEGAYSGNFTNVNLAAYDKSKLSYDIDKNGVVAIKKGNSIIGYTDVLGVSKIKNGTVTSNINDSHFTKYVVNSNVNTSAATYSMEKMKERYINDAVDGAIYSFYSANPDDMEIENLDTKFLKYEFSDFLEEKGTSTEEFNSAIKSMVMDAGPGTREGVVAAIQALVKGMSQYDVKLPYISSIDGDPSQGKYTGYGVSDDWGKNVNLHSSTYGRYYNQEGLDCSGLVSWALHNGGYKYNSIASTSYDGKSKAYENISEKISCNNYVGEPGDLLWHHGHIAMIVDKTENGNYLVAEENGGENGLIVSEYTTSGKPVTNDFSDPKRSSFTHVIKMDDYYNNESNLDLDFFE